VVLSIFPLTAPTVVIERLSISDVPAWQIAASVIVLAASVVGGLFFSSGVFRTSLSIFGKRPRLGEIVRTFRCVLAPVDTRREGGPGVAVARAVDP
jgi:ABC-2 type transport system permease protein